MVNIFLVGPFMSGRLAAEVYLDIFFQNSLSELREKILLNLQNAIWYIHDSAPTYACRYYSPDLNSFDFYF